MDTLVLMSKAPVPGTVKTRLAVDLGAQDTRAVTAALTPPEVTLQ